MTFTTLTTRIAEVMQLPKLVVETPAYPQFSYCL